MTPNPNLRAKIDINEADYDDGFDWRLWIFVGPPRCLGPSFSIEGHASPSVAREDAREAALEAARVLGLEVEQ